MRPTFRNFGLILSWSLALGLCGCGGGGGSSVKSSSQLPTVTTVASNATVANQLSADNSYTFTASATDPTAGTTIVSYNWNFGDGTTITAGTASESHAYSATGTYTLTVTAKDSTGLTSLAFTEQETVIAGVSPFNIVVATPASAVSLSVPQASTANPSPTVTYTFDFTITPATGSSYTYAVSGIKFLTNDTLTGDVVGTPQPGTNSNEWLVTVTFPPASTTTSPRTFSPTLQVTDTTGAVKSDLVTMPALTITTTVSSAPAPIVTLSATPAIVVTGTTNTTYQNVPVTFSASATDTVDPNMTYSWTFGDTNNLGDVTGSTALTITHSYALPGTYTVTFSASTGLPGGTKSIPMAMSILADTTPSISVVTNPLIYYVGQPVTFTVTDSVTGQTPTYTWSFGDNTTGTGSPVTHTFQAAGQSTVSLSADDGKGGVTSWTETLDVLLDVPPVANIVTGPSGNLYQNKAYTFVATGVQPTSGYPITSFIWNWGDGSAAQTDSNVAAGSGGTFTDTLSHTFLVSAQVLDVTVQAVDSKGSVGPASPATAFPLVATSLPVGAFTTPSGATSYFVETGTGSTVTVTFVVTASNPNGTGYLPASSVKVYPLGIAAGTTAAVTSNGNGTYNAVYAYPAAATPGTVSYTPTVQVTDLLQIVGTAASGPVVTIQTIEPTVPPSIVITQPTTQVYAMESPTLAFVLFDPIVNPVTYTINWQDGSTTSATVSPASLPTGDAISLTHQFLTAGTYNVTINASDTRSAHQTATQQSVTFTVLANALPTAQITAPLGSGTLGFSNGQAFTYFYPSGLTGTAPTITVPTSNYPIQVIPEGGSLIFTGTATPTTSGEALQSTTWIFPDAVPSSASGLGPQQVTFAGIPSALAAYLVEFQAEDVFGRLSLPAYLWVVVDSTNTENFTLNLLYRQLSDNGTTVSLNPVTTATNGLGTALQIHQDGYSNSYTISSANQASVSVPVRSNVPFYALLPVMGSDTNSYAVRIPCQPTASGSANPTGIDPELEGIKNVGGAFYTLSNRSSSFRFQSSQAPWDPALNVVTAQGFAPEGSEPVYKNLVGQVSLMPGLPPPAVSRWMELPSEPAVSYPLSWPSTDYTLGLFSGVQVNQTFAEWPLFIESQEPDLLTSLTSAPGVSALSNAAPAPSDLGFNLSYSAYSNNPATSITTKPTPSAVAAATAMEAYRVPSNSTDPYDLTHGVANWNEANCNSALNPTPVYTNNPLVLTYYTGLLFQPAQPDSNSTPFVGGLDDLVIPYDLNDPNRLPLASPLTRPLVDNFPVFSYAEYLWSTVWAQPVVLNSTNLTTTDLEGNIGYAGTDEGLPQSNWLLQSLPNKWPKLINTSLTATPSTPIEPDGSYFDLTASGAGTFTAASPVAIGTAATLGSAPVAPSSNPATTGVGHFYWTAYTPSYSSSGGALISRTWLAEGTGNQAPPIAADFTGSAATDAASGWGFVPAQDTMVDKRLRNANGSLTGAATGGYRVTWFNATRSPDGNVVPPDFWVIELNPSSGTPIHFMVPSNYPAQPNYPNAAVVTADTTQTLSGSILTDARWYIAPPTSGLVDNYSASWSALAQVAPGYCWFDVPTELRVADPATVTVFAVKSILKNQPPAAASPRPLNRPDWLDAIKTAVANMKVVPSDGVDKSLYHKIPFNFPWDIVVVNSEPTPVQSTTAP